MEMHDSSGGTTTDTSGGVAVERSSEPPVLDAV